MKISKFQFIILLLVLSLTIPMAAHAADPGGWWTSSTGSKIHIWSNMQQVVVTVQTKTGKQFKYQGWWTRFSDYFSYQVPNTGVHTCAFASNNRNIIYVRDPQGRTYTWSRGVQKTVKKKTKKTQTSGGIRGTWRSTTGNTIQITHNKTQVWVNFILTNGTRINGAGRWLTGFKFDYSIPGQNGVAVCTVDKNNWNIIYCLYGGKWTTWNKM